MNFRIVLTCLLAALVSGLFIGCEYNVPITDRRVIPVDEGLLGVWQSLPGKQKAMAGKEKILILKVHKTEYLIQYFQALRTDLRRTGFGRVELMQVALLKGLNRRHRIFHGQAGMAP